jgi:hypothetical protein
MDCTGKIEQVYAINRDSASDAKQAPPAVFVNGGRCAVFHNRDSSCLFALVFSLTWRHLI